jgi:hypothetical protein
MSTRKTAQKDQATIVVPGFRLCFPERGVRRWTISFHRKTDSATQSSDVRVRWFDGLRCVSQTDLQQLLEDRHGTLDVTGHA